MSSARMRANEVQKAIEPVRQPGREIIRRQEPGPVQAMTPQAAYRRVQLNRNGLRPADLLALQRTVGNRAVQRMLAKANDEQQDETAEEDSERTVQTKLTVGAPKDVYEQETDRVAGRVMTMPEAAAQRPNRTGLPDGLKSGVESLSGISLDSVNVHYNSSQPAQLNALAYTQGRDIHVAPGQEQHLPHEAWHVVQQAQGRVRPTMQMKDEVPVNDDEGLEHEADVMGRRAADENVQPAVETARPDSIPLNSRNGVIQTKIKVSGEECSTVFLAVKLTGMEKNKEWDYDCTKEILDRYDEQEPARKEAFATIEDLSDHVREDVLVCTARTREEKKHRERERQERERYGIKGRDICYTHSYARHTDRGIWEAKTVLTAHKTHVAIFSYVSDLQEAVENAPTLRDQWYYVLPGRFDANSGKVHYQAQQLGNDMSLDTCFPRSESNEFRKTDVEEALKRSNNIEGFRKELEVLNQKW